MMDNQELRKSMKPTPDTNVVKEFIQTNWDLNICVLKQIDSYDDANFFCSGTTRGSLEKKNYLLKVYNAYDSQSADIINGLYLMLKHIKNNITIPLLVPTTVHRPSENGDELLFLDNCAVHGGGCHRVAVRVFDWIDGVTLSECAATSEQLVEVGVVLAEVYRCMRLFDHPSFHRTHLWDLSQFHMSVPLKAHVDEADVRVAIDGVYGEYQAMVLPVAVELPRSVIMGDCNDANVIVSTAPETAGRIAGLIDFSDAVDTWAVNEIAIAIAYGLLTSFGLQHPYVAMAALLVGYCRVRPLSEVELTVLPTLVATRLSISISVGAYSISKEPDNAYLKQHAMPARRVLLALRSVESSTHVAFLRDIQEVFVRDPTVNIENSVTNELIGKYYGE